MGGNALVSSVAHADEGTVCLWGSVSVGAAHQHRDFINPLRENEEATRERESVCVCVCV